MVPSKPFVSIIIPVKNFERTIEKTFEYLLNVDADTFNKIINVSQRNFLPAADTLLNWLPCCADQQQSRQKISLL